MKNIGKIDRLIWLILAIALLIRLSIIHYGLPLWVINDEPSTILGALKMMELKSVIPAFHLQEMSSVLYYPPYISYLYIIPFSIIFIFQYLFYHIPLSTLQAIITSDLSIYFLAARFISIIFSLASIYLIYKTALAFFKEKEPALFAAFFGATSLINIALSVSARHWVFISFIYALCLFILTRETTPSKKYFWYYVVASLGMGISSISILLYAIPLFWHVLIEKNSYKSLFILFKKVRFYLSAILIAALTILPSLLYPSGNGFLVDITSGVAKNLPSILISPFLLFQTISLSEPVLILFAVLGLIVLFKKYTRLTWILLGFIYFYSIVFYLAFRFESRFTLPLLPILFVIAGYGIYELWKSNRFCKVLILIILLVPLFSSIKLADLGYRDDSRIQAVDWAYKNIRMNENVLVFGNELRLPSTKEMADKLGQIDPNALRKIDASEKQIDKGRRFNSLNVYNVRNPQFLANLNSYLKNNNFKYLITENASSSLQVFIDRTIKPGSEPLAVFGDNELPYSIATSEFKGSVVGLYKARMLGPEIRIYKLQ